MTRSARPLRFHRFGADDPLSQVEGRAGKYLRCYLADVDAAHVIEEPYYFDRDYLAEFANFYSTSARGYENVCRRLHFFAGDEPHDEGRGGDIQDLLGRGLGGDRASHDELRRRYLGFTVLRPFVPPRLGRTVLGWYPDDRSPSTGPRITAPSRDYQVHLAGLPLTVRGLAWQQQDAGISACATVALWSMLHSSAFDDHHAIPTTVDITRAAHRNGPGDSRMFPSAGLSAQQLGHAIHTFGLSPVVVSGDVTDAGRAVAFTHERLATTLAAFVRSRYPVLVGGRLLRSGGAGGHALCVTGFRDAPPPAVPPGETAFTEVGIQYVYVHDDNLGPNVRFRLTELTDGGKPYAALEPAAPPSRREHGWPNPTQAYPRFVPTTLLAAVHDELRTSPIRLRQVGHNVGEWAAKMYMKMQPGEPGVNLSTRFIGLREYMRDELPRILAGRPEVLRRVRLQLLEDVPPMSLHLGLVRLQQDSWPIADILFDTTDNNLQLRAFTHVTFSVGARSVFPTLRKLSEIDLGIPVDGS